MIGLADAIDALREELHEAVSRAGKPGLRFQLDPIELEVQAVITKDVHGKIGWGALGVGGKVSSATTQTLKLKLTPLWVTADGEVHEEFAISDDSHAPGDRIGDRIGDQD